MQTIQKESLQEARQRLLENAGPDALYEIDPYRAYERLQKQYSQDWRVFTGFTAIVFSFAASGGLLAVALPFLIGACTLEKALLYSPVLGIFGALSAIRGRVWRIQNCLKCRNSVSLFLRQCHPLALSLETPTKRRRRTR